MSTARVCDKHGPMTEVEPGVWRCETARKMAERSEPGWADCLIDRLNFFLERDKARSSQVMK